MEEYTWHHLNHLQVGRYAEYLVKMELVRRGFDVYTAEVDDRGIDFVVRLDAQRYADVQVKSARGLNYIFLRKDKFELRPNLFAAIVLFQEAEEPALFLIPSETWRNAESPFVDREYEGLKSAPEWGINLSQKALKSLEAFSFDAGTTLLREL